MSYLNRRTPLSRAQNSVLNPIEWTTEKATVISLAKSGLYDNTRGVPTCSLTVEPSEHPGHPMQLTGLASMADLVHGFKEGDTIKAVGTIHGSLGRGRTPYVVLSSIESV